MTSLQNANLRSAQSYQSQSLNPSFDYYDYDYGGYPQMQSIQRRGQLGGQMNYNNPRLGRFGTNNLYGGYSNTYGQYAGYGDYDYGGSSGYSPAQSKSSYGSYSGGYNDCPGIPIALLLVTLLGIGVMGFILFTKIQGAGRKKRDAVDSWSELLPEVETLDIIILHGRGV